MRNYGYVELSPRGFANEIQDICFCETKKEFEELVNLYEDHEGHSRRAWRIKSKDVKGITIPASMYIKLLKAEGDKYEKIQYEIYEMTQNSY